MYKKLEPENKPIVAVETTPDSQCTCVCKGGAEKKNSEAAPVNQAVLLDVVYYEIGDE